MKTELFGRAKQRGDGAGMEFEQAEKYLLSKPEAVKSYPFGPEAAVFKVKDKMFALLLATNTVFGKSLSGYPFINLKCDPEESLMLRDVFEEVLPAYHMSKRHWNSVVLKESMPDPEIERMVDRSYGLVVKGLRKPERQHLELVHGPDELYK